MISIRSKKFIPILLLALIFLAGCADKAEDYPVMEPIDFTTMELESAQDSTLKLSFPADGWTAIPDSTLLSLVYDETADTKTDVNISAQLIGKFSGTLSNKYRDSLAKAMEKNPGYLTLDLMEMRSLNGSPVIYCEATAAFTDEGLDTLLEAGTITEETIESMGGREALLSIPPSHQITMYAVVDSQLIIYTGTYYEDTQKQVVTDTLTVMISTTEIL